MSFNLRNRSLLTVQDDTEQEHLRPENCIPITALLVALPGD